MVDELEEPDALVLLDAFWANGLDAFFRFVPLKAVDILCTSSEIICTPKYIKLAKGMHKKATGGKQLDKTSRGIINLNKFSLAVED